MMDQLPAGRPVTNFLWRYLPDAGGRAEMVVRVVAWLLLVTAAAMYASRFLPVGVGRPVLDPAHTVYWDDEITAGLFVGFFLLVLANFLKRRTYVNARLRAGLSFAEASSSLPFMGRVDSGVSPSGVGLSQSTRIPARDPNFPTPLAARVDPPHKGEGGRT